MKSILIAVLTALLVPLGFWTAGYNFDARGEAALVCYLLSLLTVGMIYAWMELE